MSTEPLIRELFRTLEVTLHERLAIIEQILSAVEKPKVPLYDNEFVKRIERLEAASRTQAAPVSYSPFLEDRLTALEEQLVSMHSQMQQMRLSAPKTVEEIEEEVIEEEEPEEEEGLDLEEFEYKGITYYKDGENKVYSTDEDGNVIPEPVARWNGVKLVRL
jgi:TolA-binding protein